MEIGKVMPSTRKMLKRLFIPGALLAGWLGAQLTDTADMNAWAGSSSSNKGVEMTGDPERGRGIFSGKGVCHYCHGIDGDLSKKPPLATDTAALIARLDPPPTDLRNPKALHLKTDKQRFRIIREGHTGTGTFTDTTMTDQDIADTLAYLAFLQREGSFRAP